MELHLIAGHHPASGERLLDRMGERSEEYRWGSILVRMNRGIASPYLLIGRQPDGLRYGHQEGIERFLIWLRQHPVYGHYRVFLLLDLCEPAFLRTLAQRFDARVEYLEDGSRCPSPLPRLQEILGEDRVRTHPFRDLIDQAALLRTFRHGG